MTRKAQKLLKDALELPVKEHAAIAHRLIRSLDGPPDRDSAETWKKEIDRRINRFDAGKSKAVPWERVRDRLRRRASRTRHKLVENSAHSRGARLPLARG